MKDDSGPCSESKHLLCVMGSFDTKFKMALELLHICYELLLS